MKSKNESFALDSFGKKIEKDSLSKNYYCLVCVIFNLSPATWMLGKLSTKVLQSKLSIVNGTPPVVIIFPDKDQVPLSVLGGEQTMPASVK